MTVTTRNGKRQSLRSTGSQTELQDLQWTAVTIPLKGKPERWAFGVCEPNLTAVIVELRTRNGMSGWGEAICVHPSVEITCAILNSCKSYLIGQDAFDVERIMKSFYVGGAWHWHRHAANWALAAIEMALWDIIGQACGQPVYRLLGGAFRRAIPFVAFLFRDDPEAMAEEAKRFAAEGFETFFLKVGIDPSDDVQAVSAVREAIGPGRKLRIDANEAWSHASAVRMIEKLKSFDPEFVEQPLLASDLEGMALLRKRVGVPIGADQSAWTLFEVLSVIQQQAADVLVLDPGRTEGLLGFKKAAAIAEAAGLPVCTHAGNTFGIGVAAILHLSASTPNVLYANQTYYYRLEGDILKRPFQFTNGSLDVLDSPGLGVEPDRDKLRYYAEYHKKHEVSFASKPHNDVTGLMIPGY